ncbi:hypothetical protein [Saccharopolyspora cebuensis]|uniref:DUF397 domain-containing protein n=1 Tax=Saccharopolyspora cebuensis TaxID=418759 RepID=A0ABV4CJJ4_9PSEU
MADQRATPGGGWPTGARGAGRGAAGYFTTTGPQWSAFLGDFEAGRYDG